MDALDTQILNALQVDFPIAERPYAKMAEGLGITEDQLWQRVQVLMESGIIRRLGASLDSRRLGYQSTLVGMRVASEKFERANAALQALVEVTHSYLRKDAFNIWFTLIAVDQTRIHGILDQLKADLDLANEDLLDLPVQRLFKLDARFGAAESS